MFPFSNLDGVIIEQHGHRPPAPGASMGTPSFRVMPQAFLAYLQYQQLEDAREAAQQAERHAQQAQRHASLSLWIAVGGILVSLITTIAGVMGAIF